MVNEKQLKILCGIPGSGKSFTAKTLAPAPNIFSTDNFWIDENGRYMFSISKLRQAHEWNQRCVEAAMMEATTPIVIDNTNTTPKERKPYIDLANKYGYDYELVFPTSPWFVEMRSRLNDKTFTNTDITLLFEKNTHNVPFETIKAMMTRWQE